MLPPRRALATVVALCWACALSPPLAQAQQPAGGANANYLGTCDLASMNTMMTAMTTGCCTNPGQELNCPAGQVAPNVCDALCAQSFEPFWDACGSLLQTLGFPGVDEYAEFADRCWQSLFTPGACADGCNDRNFDCLAAVRARVLCVFVSVLMGVQAGLLGLTSACCLLQEVTTACCTTDPAGCTAGIPTTCDFECSIKLRPFMDACDDTLLTTELGAATVATL